MVQRLKIKTIIKTLFANIWVEAESGHMIIPLCAAKGTLENLSGCKSVHCQRASRGMTELMSPRYRWNDDLNQCN